MPKIRRWFNVSHDINSDPEVWELTDKFGDRGLRAWLECLSIADRNDGYIPGQSDTLLRALSIKLNTSQTRLRLILDWLLMRTWLVSDPLLRVRNYITYKPSREAKREQTVSPPRLTSEPPLTKHLKKRNNKIPMPENFSVSDEIREWCIQHRISDPESHLEAFKDYHISKGSRFIDWKAALRTWLRNSQRFNSNAPTKQKEGELSDRTMRILRRGL